MLWVITDGKKWAHGKTLKQTAKDLNFKYLKQDKDGLKNLNKEEQRKNEELINIYRVITGACLAGCQMFERNNVKKKSHTINEVIELVIEKNTYGCNKFKEFFLE